MHHSGSYPAEHNNDNNKNNASNNKFVLPSGRQETLVETRISIKSYGSCHKILPAIVPAGTYQEPSDNPSCTMWISIPCVMPFHSASPKPHT